MNLKRKLWVSVTLISLLALMLGAIGFILVSRSSAQVDSAQSNPPAALSEQQSPNQGEAELNAKYEAIFSETKDKAPAYNGYMEEGFGCSHDSQAYDLSTED